MGTIIVLALVALGIWYVFRRPVPPPIPPTPEELAARKAEAAGRREIEDKMDSFLEKAGLREVVTGSSPQLFRSDFRTSRQALDASAKERYAGDIQMARINAKIAAYLAYQERDFDRLVIAVDALKPLM